MRDILWGVLSHGVTWEVGCIVNERLRRRNGWLPLTKGGLSGVAATEMLLMSSIL